MTNITINRNGINSFFERQAFGGAITGTGRAANRLADRMVDEAVKNASGRMLHMRTGEVAKSVQKIVRRNPKTGAVEVGVGTTSKVGGHLANGAAPHTITPRSGKYLQSNGPRSKGPNPTPLRRRQRRVSHPGNRPIPWLRDAVNRVIGRPAV